MNELRLAGCIITDDENRILLLHRETPKRTQWEIPGGKVEKGETTAQTAAREVAEELGVTVKILREIGKRSFTEDDRIMEYTWHRADIIDGDPRVMEPELYNTWQYWSLSDLEGMTEHISPNTRNFLEEINADRVTL